MNLQMFALSEVADATQVDPALLASQEWRVGEDVAFLSDCIDSTRMKSHEVMRQVTLLKREFEHDRKETDKWRVSFDRGMGMMMQAPGIYKQEEEHSQSLLKDGFPQHSGGRKSGPFLKIKFRDGKEEDIYISEAATRDLLASSTQRETVRKVLLHVHENTIDELRKFTLTGRTFTDNLDNDDSHGDTDRAPEQGKTALPLRTILIVHEAVRKLHPIDPLFFRLDNGKAEKELEKLDSKTRSLITAVLNYFHRAYDASMEKIQTPSMPSGEPSKSKRKRRLENQEQN